MLSMEGILAHKTTVFLGGTEVTVEIADTQAKRERGLGGRDTIKQNTGMLFVFDTPEQYGFWMKDMKFPIDIIWFDANRRIIYEEEDVQPNSYPNVFVPRTPATFVLEVPAGFFAFHHLNVGDTFKIGK